MLCIYCIYMVFSMQTRKLVKTGAETFTLSLPKSWIRKNNLKKGDLLFIKEKANKLEIGAELKERKEKKEITITIDKKEINSIRREMISAYINNYNKFIFIGDNLSKKLDDIRKILHNFLALEIVEQTQTKIVVKDYLDLKEFSFDNIIRRMDMLIRSIILDSKNSFSDKEVSKSLVFRDYEVDKLFFLISRLVRSRDMSSKETIEYWWTAKNMENIADNVRDLSAKFEKTKDPSIINFYTDIESYYKDVMKAHFNKDRKLADKMIAKRGSLLDSSNAIKDKDIAAMFIAIIDWVRNIAKVALDS